MFLSFFNKENSPYCIVRVGKYEGIAPSHFKQGFSEINLKIKNIRLILDNNL